MTDERERTTMGLHTPAQGSDTDLRRTGRTACALGMLVWGLFTIVVFHWNLRILDTAFLCLILGWLCASSLGSLGLILFNALLLASPVFVAMILWGTRARSASVRIWRRTRFAVVGGCLLSLVVAEKSAWHSMTVTESMEINFREHREAFRQLQLRSLSGQETTSDWIHGKFGEMEASRLRLIPPPGHLLLSGSAPQPPLALRMEFGGFPWYHRERTYVYDPSRTSLLPDVAEPRHVRETVELEGGWFAIHECRKH